MLNNTSALTRVFVASALTICAAFSATGSAAQQVPFNPVNTGQTLNCNTSSVDVFHYDDIATTVGAPSLASVDMLIESMVNESGVECALCPFPDACTQRVSGTSCDIVTIAEWDGVTRLWTCSAEFDGTHHITCTPCY